MTEKFKHPEVKEHHFDDSTFIGGWYLPEELINKLSDWQDNNMNLSHEGLQGGKRQPNKDKKDSKDIAISPTNLDEPFLEYRIHLQSCLLNYVKKYPTVEEIYRFDVTENYNFQYYPVGGGFKIWHFENYHSPGYTWRSLAFMTYLNDVEDGGTEFKYQKLTAPCKKGLTLIWPAYFTHSHRGQISHTKEKKILTGWYSTIEEFRNRR